MTPSTLARNLREMPDNAKGAAILMVAAGLFALMTAFIKLLGEHLHVTQILFIRQVVMTAIVAPGVVRGFPGVLITRRPILQLIRIGLALIAMLCGFSAVIHMPLAEATAIGFAKSFFVTIFAVIVLSEVVGIRRWMAVAAGFFGVFVMLGPGTGGFTYYGILALIGAACAGMVMVIIRLLSRTERPVTILAWQAFGVGVAMAVPALYFWQWPTMTEWGLLLAMGGFSYAAQMANINAYKFGEASVLASLDYVRLLYATLLGWLIFDSLPGWNTWAGAAIIVLAAIYTIWRESQRKQQLTRSPEGRGFTS